MTVASHCEAQRRGVTPGGLADGLDNCACLLPYVPPCYPKTDQANVAVMHSGNGRFESRL